jgi:hypothetical protein
MSAGILGRQQLWSILGWNEREPGTATLYRAPGPTTTSDPASALRTSHSDATALAATLTETHHLGLRWKPVPEGTNPHEQQAARRIYRPRPESRRPDGLPDGW